jgi:hypothetical protein
MHPSTSAVPHVRWHARPRVGSRSGRWRRNCDGISCSIRLRACSSCKSGSCWSAGGCAMSLTQSNLSFPACHACPGLPEVCLSHALVVIRSIHQRTTCSERSEESRERGEWMKPNATQYALQRDGEQRLYLMQCNRAAVHQPYVYIHRTDLTSEACGQKRATRISRAEV